MSTRKFKHRAQEMHGYRQTKSGRVPSGGLDPFTGMRHPTSSVRFSVSSWGNAAWRKYRANGKPFK